MIKTKKKFVNVTPLSSKAKNRFVNIMESFHACEVEQEKDGMIFLASINKKYFFWLQQEGNEHWRIDK
jgi:hypothetical protein